MSKWTIEYYDQKLFDWVKALPVSIRADYARLTELLENFGCELRLPHSRAMGKGLFELRPRGKEGIARIFYCMVRGKSIIVLHGFVKKTQKTPLKELDKANKRMKEVMNEQT
jgi:phage-related protein